MQSLKGIERRFGRKMKGLNMRNTISDIFQAEGLIKSMFLWLSKSTSS